MAEAVGATCVNCRDTFTVEAAIKHSEPEVCVEWGNHQMGEGEVAFHITVVDTTTTVVSNEP